MATLSKVPLPTAGIEPSTFSAVSERANHCAIEAMGASKHSFSDREIFSSDLISRLFELLNVTKKLLV